MTLDVAIVTWQPDGMSRIEAMKLPQVEGVRYIVSWQETGTGAIIPQQLAERVDIEVHVFNGSGVAANRNNALKHCQADVVLMADDDLRYTTEQLKSVIEVFAADETLDVATFRYEGAVKEYPSEECQLGFPLPKNYGVATFEIAVRRRVLDRIKFDERFGPGAKVWQAGEDEKFLIDARKAGLNCRFFPITITHHEGLTTGDRPLTNRGVAAGQGRIVRLEYPRSWWCRIVLKSWREWRKHGTSPAFTLFNLFRGALETV